MPIGNEVVAYWLILGTRTLIGRFTRSNVKLLFGWLLNTSCLIEKAFTRIGNSVITTKGFLVPVLRTAVVLTAACRTGRFWLAHNQWKWVLIEWWRTASTGCAHCTEFAVIRKITEHRFDVCIKNKKIKYKFKWEIKLNSIEKNL